VKPILPFDNALSPSSKSDELWDSLFSNLPGANNDEQPLSFREFIKRVSPRYQFYRHCDELIDILQRVADDELHRVLVFMPPRHSKSETVSRLFTAYYLYRHPDRFVGLASYGADLAYTLSRAARDNFTKIGGKLSKAAKAVKQWMTTQGGGFWATGVGGPATGKGFHLGVIDDPVKDAQEAASDAIRMRNKDWFDSVFSTREEPGGAVVVLQTRWHEDDLSGYLLSLEADEPESWYIVNMQAIRESSDVEKFPDSCTVHQDWREDGEALCPERYSLEKLRKLAKRIGDYFFGALFQQRPRPREGGQFKAGCVGFIDAQEVPRNVIRVRRWDLAATANGGDYTVGTLIAYQVDEGITTIEDVVRGQWDSAQRDRIIKETAELDLQRGAVTHVFPQDPGSAGKDVGRAFIRLLAGFSVKTELESGDKATRADPFASQWNAGNVQLVRAPWNKAFIDEHLAFPSGKYDDQVDTSGGGYNYAARQKRTDKNRNRGSHSESTY
jgi:predicted phage terminase large subunit-like protein